MFAMMQLSQIVPSQEHIIGYVTSANFSLSRGEAFAIGAISATRILELITQAERYGFA